ncbi:PLD nuclease N-terminal domain-containing protein [Nesterenkonia suensis]
MLKVIVPLGIVGVGLMIYSLIECFRTPRHRVRVLGKGAWLAVILLVPILGAGLWLGLGRPRSGPSGPAPRRQAAPDDDPNFLQNLEIQRRQKQREEELRRKEAELEAKQKREAQKDQPQKTQDPKKPDDAPPPERGAAGQGPGTAEEHPGNGRPPKRSEDPAPDPAPDAAEDTDVEDPRNN